MKKMNGKEKMETRTSRIFAAVLVLLSVVVISSSFASAPGSTSMNFLKIGVGARATGMGEAHTAVANDVNAMYWNPAGLRQIEDREASMMHTRWFSDITYQHFLYAQPLEMRNMPKQTVGFGVYKLSYGDIEGADFNGTKTSALTAGDVMLTVSDSLQIKQIRSSRLLAGFTMKYISETLDTVSASALALDAGLLYVHRSLSYGLSLKNLGTPVRFVKESYGLPTSLTVGGAWTKKLFSVEDPLTVAADISLPFDSKPSFSIGAEYSLLNMFSARIGYKTGESLGSGLKFGVGFKMNIFQFDFSFAQHGDMGDTYRAGMTVKFGRPTKLRVTSEAVNIKDADVYYRNGMYYYNNNRYLEAIMEFNKVLEMDSTNAKAVEMMRLCNEKLQK